METLKLLPQLFYDLISRVIPGVIGLVLISSALERPLGSLISEPFAGAPSLQDSPLFLGIATVGAAYIVGQMLAPISDLYERRLIRSVVPLSFWVFPAALETESPYPAAMRRFLQQELELGGETPTAAVRRFTVVLFVWYDWLRVWKPEAGMRVTKLRAEYRMFGGVAVASWIAAVLHLSLVSVGSVRLQPGFLLVSFLVVGFASWGMVRTYRTFQWSVLNQYYVARGLGSLREAAVPEPPRLEPVP